ncbi:O-antigen ligase family protein [Endozoicomonas sp. Mp262]|uniref:O-antigen ligase family protein n=1 Tax=Endozoicomonas sp. Mp262 TaxID=2919499 RepID=UPI0021DACA39
MMAILLVFQISIGNTLEVKELLRILFLIVLVGMLSLLANRGFFEATTNVLYLINFIIVLIGLFNIIFGNYRIIEGVPRLNGTYSHPNPYGMHVILTLCAFFILYKYNAISKLKFVLFFLLGLVVFLRILNFSSIIAGFVFFGFVYVYDNQRSRLLKMIFGVLVSLIIIYLLYLISDVFRNRMEFILETDLVANVGYAENSVQWRFLNWSYYLRNINNYVIGEGVGYSDIFFRQAHNTLFTVLAPHNEWLKVLFECGLLGLTFILCFLLYVSKNLSIPSKGLLLCYLTACFFDNFFKSTSLVLLVVILIFSMESISGGYKKQLIS